MDVLLALAFAFGLVYAMVLGARWAFKIDQDEWRKRERLSRRERTRITSEFEDIARDLRRKPEV